MSVAVIVEYQSDIDIATIAVVGQENVRVVRLPVSQKIPPTTKLLGHWMLLQETTKEVTKDILHENYLKTRVKGGVVQVQDCVILPSTEDCDRVFNDMPDVVQLAFAQTLGVVKLSSEFGAAYDSLQPMQGLPVLEQYVSWSADKAMFAILDSEVTVSETASKKMYEEMCANAPWNNLPPLAHRTPMREVPATVVEEIREQFHSVQVQDQPSTSSSTVVEERESDSNSRRRNERSGRRSREEEENEEDERKWPIRYPLELGKGFVPPSKFDVNTEIPKITATIIRIDDGVVWFYAAVKGFASIKANEALLQPDAYVVGKKYIVKLRIRARDPKVHSFVEWAVIHCVPLKTIYVTEKHRDDDYFICDLTFDKYETPKQMELPLWKVDDVFKKIYDSKQFTSRMQPAPGDRIKAMFHLEKHPADPSKSVWAIYKVLDGLPAKPQKSQRKEKREREVVQSLSSRDSSADYRHPPSYAPAPAPPPPPLQFSHSHSSSGSLSSRLPHHSLPPPQSPVVAPPSGYLCLVCGSPDESSGMVEMWCPELGPTQYVVANVADLSSKAIGTWLECLLTERITRNDELSYLVTESRQVSQNCALPYSKECKNHAEVKCDVMYTEYGFYSDQIGAYVADTDNLLARLRNDRYSWARVSVIHKVPTADHPECWEVSPYTHSEEIQWNRRTEKYLGFRPPSPSPPIYRSPVNRQSNMVPERREESAAFGQRSTVQPPYSSRGYPEAQSSSYTLPQSSRSGGFPTATEATRVNPVSLPADRMSPVMPPTDMRNPGVRSTNSTTASSTNTNGTNGTDTVSASDLLRWKTAYRLLRTQYMDKPHRDFIQAHNPALFEEITDCLVKDL